MPTVLRTRGYRFYFYSHEPNEPPHVHVDKGGASVKVWLEPVAIARNSGFSATELAEVVRLVQQSRSALLEAWHEFFR
jgi:hypothetical protein